MLCYSTHYFNFPEVYLLIFTLFANFPLNYLNSSQKVCATFVMFKWLATIETVRVNT